MRSNAPLEVEQYPFQFELQTRFSDLDLQGHINNVQIANIYQEGRVQFHREAFRELRKSSDEHRHLRTVLANINIAYLHETFYPRPLILGVGVGRIGNSSYTLTCGLFQGGQCKGTSEAVLVFVSQGKSTAMPEATRTALSQYLIASKN